MEDAAESVGVVKVTGGAVAKALACFWGAFVALNTLRAALLGYDHPIESLERRVLVGLAGAALCWGMYRLLVRLRPATVRGGILLTSAMSLPAALVFSTVDFLMTNIFTPAPGEACQPGAACTAYDLAVNVSDMLIDWAFVFMAWGLLYLSLASAAQARAADQRSSAHREAARLAQIRALRYQVNPHFLFNVLNSLTALVSRRETAEAEALIAEIGRFFRYSLAADPVADVTLGDEVEMQRRYLEIERRRFPQRLSVVIDVPAAASNLPAPPLILQPLVENAIKHGVGRSGRPVTVAIRAAILDDGRLRVVVEDDAPEPDGPAPDGLGVGLQNVAERLATRYGPQARFSAGRRAGGGYLAELIIPTAQA